MIAAGPLNTALPYDAETSSVEAARLDSAEPERTVHSGAEWEVLDVPLTDVLLGNDLDIYPEILAGHYFDIEFKSDRLALSGGGYVGYIPLNDRVAIDIAPRVPIENLERLFVIGKGRPLPLRRHIRRYAPHVEIAPSLLDTLAEALADSIAEIERLGLHREYVQRIEEATYPRGRVLNGRTLQRFASVNVRHRVATSWFEPTVNTAPNQCLKYALWTVSQRYSRMKQLSGERLELLARVNRAFRVFDGVHFGLGRDWLNHPLVKDPRRMPPIRAYYEDPLYLAVALLSDQGIRFREQGVLALPSLLLDMTDLFEAYIREVLDRFFKQSDQDIRVLDGNLSPPRGDRKRLFDQSPSVDATPDVVLRPSSAHSSPVLVEVKYKPLGGIPERSDVNQVIAYAASYRSHVVVLAQPVRRNADAGLRPLGQIDDLRVYTYGLDVGSAKLPRVESDFGKAMQNLLAAAGDGAADRP